MWAIAFVSFLTIGGLFVAVLPAILETRERCIWFLLVPGSAVSWIAAAWLAVHVNDVIGLTCLGVFAGFSLICAVLWGGIVVDAVRDEWKMIRRPAPPMPTYPKSIKTAGRKTAAMIVMDALALTGVAVIASVLLH